MELTNDQIMAARYAEIVLLTDEHAQLLSRMQEIEERVKKLTHLEGQEREAFLELLKPTPVAEGAANPETPEPARKRKAAAAKGARKRGKQADASV